MAGRDSNTREGTLRPEMSRPDTADFGDEDAFLSSIVRGLPNDGARVVGALERAKSVYVECGRDTLLRKSFGKFLEQILARRETARDDGRCFFVTGPSGAGKSALVRRLLKDYPFLQPAHHSFGPVSPVVSIALSGPCILKTLGRSILEKAGYPLKQNLQQSQTWELIPRQLRLRKVLLIHIDEPQHMLRNTERDQERKNVAKAFKGVMNNPDWPVSFILSGMPETTELARLDEQIERRAYQFPLADVSIPGERRLVERIMSEMSAAAGIDASGLVETDVPERMAHAAAYRYARITQVTLAGLHAALSNGDTELKREHFALAYLEHSHARGHDDMNPFLVGDWARLPPGSFLIETDD